MSIRSKYARVFDQTDEMKWTMVNAIDAIRTPYNFVSHIFRLCRYIQDDKISPWNKKMDKHVIDFFSSSCSEPVDRKFWPFNVYFIWTNGLDLLTKYYF